MGKKKCRLTFFRYITPVALAGMVAIGLAAGVVLYYCFVDHLIPHGVPDGALLRSPWSTFPIAFGVNVYLFEGLLWFAQGVLFNSFP